MGWVRGRISGSGDKMMPWHGTSWQSLEARIGFGHGSVNAHDFGVGPMDEGLEREEDE
jgi:hypothetical protein